MYAPEMQDIYMYRVLEAWVGPGTSPGSFAWGWGAFGRENPVIPPTKIPAVPCRGRSTPRPVRCVVLPNWRG